MLKHSLRWLLLVIVAITPLIGLGSAGLSPAAGVTTRQLGFPVTVHSANGNVTFTSKPTAIVSLSPTATEMLYAIGAGKQVKAVDKFSDFPKGTPMTNLDGNDPNIEAIAKYNPDLVVLSQDTSALNRQLQVLGIKVLVDPAAENLSQEYQQFAELGEATGHATGAKTEVAKIKSQIARIVRNAPKLAHPETYYYELDQTYYTVTSSTFIGKLLGLLNLKSIADAATGFAANGGYPQLNSEFILKANPDYIFLADTLCCDQSAATVADRPGWSVISAVKERRVLGLNDDIASRWGPRVVILLQEVANEMKLHTVGTR